MLDENDHATGIALGVVLAIVAALVFGVVMLAAKSTGGALESPAMPAAAAEAEAEAVSAKPANAAITLGTFGFAVINGKMTLTGVAADDASRERLVSQAALMFGAESITDEITLDVNAQPRRWKGNSLDLMTKLKSLGDFRLALYGKADTINFKATVASDAVKAEWMVWLSTFFKDGVKVNVDINIDPKLVNAAGYNPGTLLNERIEFASASAEIPRASQQRLQLLAKVIREDGRRLNIVGHTDSEGNADINRTLSTSRAEAVKSFLVSQGVPAEHLSASGRGQEQPIADNRTPEGRQKNRRIEFLN
jgi:OmpA-OmpF porin, OOP family